MITCALCGQEPRKIHEYVVDNSGNKYVVWYCCSCDWTLVLTKSITNVIWEKK